MRDPAPPTLLFLGVLLPLGVLPALQTGAEELMRAPARSGFMGHLTRIANRIVQLCNSSPALDALVAKNEAWGEWQGTGLKRRNALENVYQWSCG